MKLLAFIVTTFFSTSAAIAGGAVGNGGDSLFCQPDPSNEFVGWYNLDYAINKLNGMQFSGDFEKVVGPKDPPDHNFVRLIEDLREYPLLVHELTQFREMLYANQYQERYVWKKAPFGVTEVNDEQLRIKVPPNCLTENGNVIQIIIRETKSWEKVTVVAPNGRRYHFTGFWGANFTYSNTVVEQMSPLQVSFLLFHEWLRNLTDDPETLRDLNAIFHSLGWEEDPEAKLELVQKFRLEKLSTLKLFRRDPFKDGRPL